MRRRTATLLIYSAALFPLVLGFEHFMTAMDDWRQPDVRLDPGMFVVGEPIPHPARRVALVSTALLHVAVAVAFASILVERRFPNSDSAPIELPWGLWVVAACELMFLPYSALYVFAFVGL